MSTHIPVDEGLLATVTKYDHLLVNTGGNDPAELLLDLQPYEDGRPNRLMSTNVVRFVLAVAVESQALLLARLERKGLLTPEAAQK